MNYKAYFAITKRLEVEKGIEVDRRELVKEYTKGKTNSLSSLTERDYHGFISWINETFKMTSNDHQYSKEDRLNEQRRKIIALFRKQGYEMNGKADMHRIYAWVIKYGYLSKPMNKYTADEIPKLVSQAERVYESFVKGL